MLVCNVHVRIFLLVNIIFKNHKFSLVFHTFNFFFVYIKNSIMDLKRNIVIFWAFFNFQNTLKAWVTKMQGEIKKVNVVHASFSWGHVFFIYNGSHTYND